MLLRVYGVRLTGSPLTMTRQVIFSEAGSVRTVNIGKGPHVMASGQYYNQRNNDDLIKVRSQRIYGIGHIFMFDQGQTRKIQIFTALLILCFTT